MTRLFLGLTVAALLAACVPDTPPTTYRPATGIVTFTPVRDDRDGYCLVGYTVTYPEDIAPHSRRITVTEPAIGSSNSYNLPIPPMGPPSAYSRQGNMITFARLGDASIVDCDPSLTQRSLTVGPCTGGTCAPARFAPDPTLASLRLDGRVQE